MRVNLRGVLLAVLIGLPLLSLALNAIAWLHHGLDLPFYDDWRGYANGQIQSLNPWYLLRPVNDTMSPVGFALDAIAQRWIDGNSVAYQLLSMLAVLGALLALQWLLLARALQDRLLTAASFVFTLPMLQPGSYWGRENLAYHQALPLVFLLAALWVALHAPWRERWRVAVVFGLGGLAGMTYISGAFGTLGLAGAMLVLAWAGTQLPWRRRVLTGGAALLAAGGLAAATQFVRSVLPVMGAAHRPEAPIALPYELEFWIFYLGKIGRSLLLPREWPMASFVAVVVVLALVAWVVARTLREARRGPVEDSRAQVGAMVVALSGLVFVYMLLVAAGRTHLRPVEVNGAREIFAFAFQRFHFFWATLLWPWLAAAGLLALRAWWNNAPQRAPWRSAALAVPVTLAVVFFVHQGAFAHDAQFALDASFRKPTVACLHEQLQRGDKINCPEFNLVDFRGAYLHARRIHASFIRYFPIPVVPLGAEEPWPWFRLTRDRTGRVFTLNVEKGSSMPWRSADDPQFHVLVGDPGSAAGCVVMDVHLKLKVQRTDAVKVYFRPLGAPDYSEAFTQWAVVEAGRSQVVRLRLESERGFEPGMRIDPVTQPQEFDLEEIEIRCPLRDPRFAGGGLFSIRTGFLQLERTRIQRLPQARDRYLAGDDAQLRIHVIDRQALAQCGLLEVELGMAAERPDNLQVYFRPPGAKQFDETMSVRRPVAGGGKLEKLLIDLHSAQGFDNVIRFDPVQGAQEVQIKDLVLTCRQRIPPPDPPAAATGR